jgi:hypothetical protein
VNYEGPPKVFWEYRSLAGPFWKGNVRNGFAIYMAEKWMAEPVEEYIEVFANLKLTDYLSGTKRRITFEDVALEYDLREMRT